MTSRMTFLARTLYRHRPRPVAAQRLLPTTYGLWAWLSSAITHAGRSSMREEARQRQRHTQAGREHDQADAERDERGRARQPRRRARALLADRARRRACTQTRTAALRRTQQLPSQKN